MSAAGYPAFPDAIRRKASLLVATLVIGLSLTVADAGYCASYIYDQWGRAVDAPEAYRAVRIVDGQSLGIGSFKEPQDIFVSPGGVVHVLDSGNNRVVRLDDEWNVLSVIDEIETSTGPSRLSNPQGIFVDEYGAIYIADTGNRRIVKLDATGRLLAEIGSPEVEGIDAFTSGLGYMPLKVGVDKIGRMYVIARGVNEGLIQLGQTGNFMGFIGAPRVSVSLSDLVWSRIFTREQRDRMVLFLPVEYNNLHIDDKGFLYVTMAVGENATLGELISKPPIKRLSPSGVDVLVRQGPFPPAGDLAFPDAATAAAVKGPATLVDVTTVDAGIYCALDAKRGRVFVYERRGHLLFVFGSTGSRMGTFRAPVAVEWMGKAILVLDSAKNSITVFEPTEYASSVIGAIILEQLGRYDQAIVLWEQVLKWNAEYDLAHVAIGRARLAKGMYKDSMDSFRLGNDRKLYSEALADYRSEVVGRYFGIVATCLVVLLMVVAALSVLRRRTLAGKGIRGPLAETSSSSSGSLTPRTSLLADLKYVLHVCFHPADGSWNLKHTRKGAASASVVILSVVCLGYVFMRQYTGFVFNPRDVSRTNLIAEAASILVPFSVWCAVNWAVTTLMDGKGTARDVFVVASYGLSPIALVGIPLTVVSHFMVAEEAVLYDFLLSGAVIWAAVLIFVGTMVIHEYEGVTTTVTAIALTAFGMGVVFFVALLYFSLMDAIKVFVSSVLTEYRFRL